MSLAGLIRYRKHQLGRQSSIGTAVAAVKAYAWAGVPDVNRNWTDQEVDVGSLDPIAEPYLLAPDITAPLTSPALRYNDLPALLAAIFGGDVTPTGAGDAKTWAFAPASLTVDDPDVFTYEFGDDVLTDWYQLRDGILESLELVGPTGLGPLTMSGAWRFGAMFSSGSTDNPDSPAVPTAALDVDPSEAIVYLKDGALDIASTVAGLDAGQITNALHSFTWRVSGDIDIKRFANGAQAFDVDGYGRATRMIEFVLVFAKTDDTVGEGSESDAWMSNTAVARYMRLRFESLLNIETGPDVPYSFDITAPCRYYTREEGAEGGNSTITLTAHAFYDADDLEAAILANVVCTQATI